MRRRGSVLSFTARGHPGRELAQDQPVAGGVEDAEVGGPGRLRALPGSLPAALRYTVARRSGLSDRRLRDLRADGLILSLSRSLFLRQDAPPADLDLLEIAAREPDATLCLRSRNGLFRETELLRGLNEALASALPSTWSFTSTPETRTAGARVDAVLSLFRSRLIERRRKFLSRPSRASTPGASPASCGSSRSIEVGAMLACG